MLAPLGAARPCRRRHFCLPGHQLTPPLRGTRGRSTHPAGRICRDLILIRVNLVVDDFLFLDILRTPTLWLTADYIIPKP